MQEELWSIYPVKQEAQAPVVVSVLQRGLDKTHLPDDNE